MAEDFKFPSRWSWRVTELEDNIRTRIELLIGDVEVAQVTLLELPLLPATIEGAKYVLLTWVEEILLEHRAI